MTFASLGLIEPLLNNLSALGYTKPTPVQTQAIPPILEGRDLMAAAQTGTGKTAGFALPLMQRLLAEETPTASNSIRALILVPTRELAEQVNESLRTYGKDVGLSSYATYGGVSINPQMMRLRRGVDILVATPGRLLDLYRQKAVKLKQVSILVLDEADRMLDLGFAQELDLVLGAIPKQRQTLLFSATFSDEIRGMAKRRLHDPVSIEVSPRNAAAKTVKQWVVTVDKRKKAPLFCRLLKRHDWRQVLVFVKTRKGVDELVETLQARQISADSIHGDKPQASRLQALQRFKDGEVRILVATDVAARGLDIDDLPVVVNFDLPIVAADYVHRIGRTGRAGASGEAVSLVCADEVGLLAAIEGLIRQVLPREEEEGFEAEHRVPLTQPGAAVTKKPKKPKASKAGPGSLAKGILNNWVDYENSGAPKSGRRRPGPAAGKVGGKVGAKPRSR